MQWSWSSFKVLPALIGPARIELLQNKPVRTVALNDSLRKAVVGVQVCAEEVAVGLTKAMRELAGVQSEADIRVPRCVVWYAHRSVPNPWLA